MYKTAKIDQSAPRLYYPNPPAYGDHHLQGYSGRLENVRINDQISNQNNAPKLMPNAGNDGIYSGPRGGKYRLTAGGRKVYLKNGGGPLDFLKKGVSFVSEGVKRAKAAIAGPRTGPGPDMRKLLAEYGDKKITDFYVCRTPIFNNLSKIANFLSAGDYDKAKKLLHYDDMYHLYTIIVLEDGTKLKLEKNEEPELKKVSENEIKNIETEGTQCKRVNGIDGKTLTINDLIKNGETVSGKNKFYVYDIVDANCQLFVMDLLKGSNLLTSELDNFIMQNVSEVLKTLPSWSQKVARLLPNIKSQLNILFKGVGRRRDLRHIYRIMGGNIKILELGLRPRIR